MEQILELFKDNPWLNIVFLFLAIISILLAVIFYIRSLKTRKPVYSKQTNRLVNSELSALSNLEIKYNKSIIENLSVTKIAIWNSGKEPIRQTDIASSDPLKILASDDVELYDFELINHNTVNNIELIKDQLTSIKVSFEFLNYNDGFILNIFHNGKSSEDIIIKGTFVGSEKITEGIRKEYFLTKVNYLSNPLLKLFDSKYLILKILGVLLAFPLALLITPLFMISVPMDIFFDKIMNKTPKEFFFND